MTKQNNSGKDRSFLTLLRTSVLILFFCAFTAPCYGDYDSIAHESSFEKSSWACVEYDDCCTSCDDIFIVENVHGFLQFATNERYHGISFTDNKMCIQGLLLWNHENSGIYVGIYSESNASPGTDVLFVPTLGISKKQFDLTFDLKTRFWVFPGNDADRRLDFFECIGSVSYAYKNAVFTAGLSYSPEYYYTRYTELYPYINVVVTLPCSFKLSAEYGYEYLKKWQIIGFDSHHVFDISLTRDFKGFYAGLRYVDTNLKGSHDVFGLAKPVFIGFIGRAF